MRSFALFALAVALLASTGVAYAAPPPDAPPGLERAIQAKERHAEVILGIQGVAGVGVGLNGQGRPAVIVFTETPGVRGIPAELEGGIPVISRVSGKFTANPKPEGAGKAPKEASVDPTDWFERPVPIGVSTGHPAITAGTIGARVTDGTNVYALSNNHVYADENQAGIGNAVIQPGTYDGGKSPVDNIGTLTNFVPIGFSTSANNVVDAAIAQITTTETGQLAVGNATPSNGYGTPKSATTQATINMKVKKYGRTTGLTTGSVAAINTTVNVGYSSGTARFVAQIIITPGRFSSGGDSGSLIVADGGTHDLEPVGLLFAGSRTYTVANPIDAVLNAFGVTIDGE